MKKRGVSPLLAAVILIIIVLTASVVIYVNFSKQIVVSGKNLDLTADIEFRTTGSTGSSSGEWLTGWPYRRKITITNNAPTDLIDYQVLINSSILARSDIRFTDSDGVTLLSYWIEDVSKGLILVKVPSIPASSNKTIYVYYGNTTAPNLSNGTATFIFFEDMEVWSGWIQYGRGIVSQDSSRAYEGTYSAHKTRYNDPNGAWKAIGATLGRDIAVESWVNRNSGSTGGPWDRVGVVDDDGNGYGSGANLNGDDILIDVRTNMLGGATVTANVIDEVPEDSWYMHRLIILSNGTIRAEFEYPRGTVVASMSITDTSYSTFTNYYIAGGNDYWVDLVRIRKYVEPEPTILIGDEETPLTPSLNLLLLEMYNTGNIPISRLTVSIGNTTIYDNSSVNLEPGSSLKLNLPINGIFSIGDSYTIFIQYYSSAGDSGTKQYEIRVEPM